MVEIVRANFPEDSPVVAELFLGYLNFLFERAPEEKENIVQKYNPDNIDSLVEEFSKIHARPKGELLIAKHNQRPIGCAMMREMEPGIGPCCMDVFLSDVIFVYRDEAIV